MHIIIAVLGAAAAAFWAFRYFVTAAREGRDAVSDAKGLWRSGRWSRKVSARLVENLEDPREAAAILLYQVASYDGAVTDAQRQAMVAEMRAAFDADEETAEGLFAFTRMAVGQVEDAGNALRKVLEPVISQCTEDERRQLLEMARKTANVEGPVNDLQQRLLNEAKRRLFPQ